MRPGIIPSELEFRMEGVKSKLEAGDLVVVIGNNLQFKNSDIERPFRQDSNFWYLTGYNEPEAILLIYKDTQNQTSSHLYVKKISDIESLWTGRKNNLPITQSLVGADQVKFLDLLEEDLLDLRKFIKHVFLDFKSLHNNQNFEKTYRLLQSQLNFTKISDLNNLSAPLRIIKSSWEQDQLRRSSQINTLAFSKVQTFLDEQSPSLTTSSPLLENFSKPKLYEYHLQAELEYVYRQHGLDHAYEPIIAANQNATHLHYTYNYDEISKNSLILIDAGCEYNYYASDITRTFKFGKINQFQKSIYQLVLEANQKAIHQVEKGIDSQEIITLQDLHQTVVKILTQGLLDLNILSGSLEENLENQKYTKYYMHATSHWLGLDTHDVGSYRDPVTSQPTKLIPGMCFTIEPGLYLPIDDESIPEEFRGFGVRIEDDILIKSGGVEVLSEGAGK